ncbi:MAG: ExeM/NucH family extracellular endonuclease [Anaerolineae bacterium]|nr:ExeM/NucH family extracellular endonuclease [Anaerolineae bacterium]
MAALAALALAFAPGAHVAQASASGIVISALNGGGGNSNADFTHDYIELFNAGASSVDISNWSVQYAGGTGTSWGNLTVIPASTTLQAGQYYLIQEAAGSGNGVALPTPDHIDPTPINMGGGGGKVALFNVSTEFTGGNDPTTSPNYVDFVGYGSSATTYEGTGPTPPVGNGIHAVRASSGCQDTDDNSADFAAVDVFTPRNTASALNPCIAPDLVTDVAGASNGVTGTAETYTAVVTNQGNAQADNVVMTVDLSGTAFAGATVGSFVDPSSFCAYSSPTVTCTIGTLTASSSYTVSFDVTPTVDGTLTLDSDATSNPADAGPNTDQHSTVFSAAAPDVTVSITESVDPVLSTDTLTLTFTISNVGTADASNYTLSSTLRGGIGTFDAAPVGCTLSSGNTVLDCTFAGPLSSSGSPTIVNADVSFTAAGTLTTDATAQVTGDPNTANDADNETTTVNQGCGVAWDSIHDYQEGGVNAAVRGVVITTEGVVTADFQPGSPNGIGGFFVQEKFPDANPVTSEGMFVFNNSFPVNAGDYIRITGTIVEYDPSGGTPGGTLTQLSSVSNVTTCATGDSVLPTQVSLPIASLADWENYESMLVKIVGSSGALTVADMYALGSVGEMIVSDGKLYQPTHLYAPGSTDALNHMDLVSRARIVVDDQRNGTGPNPVPHFPADANGLIRMGDQTDSITGVILYTEFSSTPMFRLHYTVAPTFTEVNPRPTTAPSMGTPTLTVASFNVLNYFNGDGAGGGFNTPDQRGADNPTEFTRQTDKLVSAINKLDADIVGLMEIENDGEIAGENQAIVDLVTALNTAAGSSKWSYIDTGPIGGDDIRVALIYQPAAATPVGTYAVLDNVEPFISYSRPPLAQTFADVNGGKFTIVVNHFKSKGCGGATGADADQGDGQGCYNATRVMSAAELLNWLNTAPTGTNDADYLLVGDFNSYAKEDPIAALQSGGYNDLHSSFIGGQSYSYYYSGQAGYLDYALASAGLVAQITDAAVWHINSDEATIFDYNTYSNTAPYYAVNEFRTSDHDPILVGLSLTGTDAALTAPASIVPGEDGWTVSVTDADLMGSTVDVLLTSSRGESETVTLTDQGGAVFSATVDTSINLSAPATGNSIIEVAHGDTLTVTYNDANTAAGTPAQRIANITVAFTTTPDGFTLIETAPVLREADFDLTWNAATDAAAYRVLVTQTSTNTRLGVYIDTAVETADVCAAGLCTYSVVGSIPGQFSWTVVALGVADVEASNAPAFYTVILDNIELVSNGGFEVDTDTDDNPDGWVGSNLNGDKRKCGAKGDGSDCALQFKGDAGLVAKFKQPLADASLILATDVLDISAAASVNRDNAGTFVIVKVNYASPTAGANGDGKDKVKLKLIGPAPTGYTTISDTLTAADDVTSAVVKVKYKLTSGKLFVDDVSVMLQALAPRTRLGDGESLDILPVPAAPDGFRGKN